jgi:hypothetical protein
VRMRWDGDIRSRSLADLHLHLHLHLRGFDFSSQHLMEFCFVEHGWWTAIFRCRQKNQVLLSPWRRLFPGVMISTRNRSLVPDRAWIVTPILLAQKHS